MHISISNNYSKTEGVHFRRVLVRIGSLRSSISWAAWSYCVNITHEISIAIIGTFARQPLGSDSSSSHSPIIHSSNVLLTLLLWIIGEGLHWCK